MVTKSGKIKSIIFESEETNFKVIRIKTNNLSNEIIAVGKINMEVHPGQRIEIKGDWKQHEEYGRQLKIKDYNLKEPASEEEIKVYLGSKFINGIGPELAKRLVSEFGKDSLEVISEEPERLTEVEGIGEKRAKAIEEAVKEKEEKEEALNNLMLSLLNKDVSKRLIEKIYDSYGKNSLQVVKNNPYQLIEDIRGFAFKRADRLAKSMGIERRSSFRIKAGIKYTLKKALDNGNTFLPQEVLLDKSENILGVDKEKLSKEVDNLLDSGEIVKDDENIYLSSFYWYETRSAKKLMQISNASPQKLNMNGLNDVFLRIQNKEGLKFTENQKEAMRRVLKEQVIVITGGPGTGKTTIVKTLVKLLQNRRNYSVALTAPTGRAAKRLSEAVGLPAKTIHRLLKYEPHTNQFQKDDSSPLNYDCVIVDEASMIDLRLFYNLVQAIKKGTKFVLVGDDNQLPSVGPGRVLSDIINSKEITTVELKKIHRQAKDNLIIENSHRIIRGKVPIIKNESGADFFFLEEDNPTKGAEKIINLFSHRLPKKYDFTPLQDIQIITPMYKAAIGADNLNCQLQKKLLSGKKGQKGLGGFFRGDKVMQVRNNYDKNVFNGDIGRVVKIDERNNKLISKFDNPIEYKKNELDQLKLAYAITVHKSQGSEFPAIIFPLYTQHALMLKRDILYTGITRAEEIAVLVGMKKALNMAVYNNKTEERHTSLDEKIRQNNQEGQRSLF